MNLRHVFLGTLVCIILATTFGCGPTGPKTYPVSGTVTWNGEPLPEGDIVLVPTSPGDIEAHSKITAGKFAFTAQAGNKKVKIMASRPEGPVDPQMGGQPRVSYLPAKYSSAEKTELTAIVGESETNPPLEFKLVGP